MGAFTLITVFLLLLPRLQVSSGGCLDHPVLCCGGTNHSCKRDTCYCDEVCVSLTDCCSDYLSVCKNTPAVTVTAVTLVTAIRATTSPTVTAASAPPTSAITGNQPTLSIPSFLSTTAKIPSITPKDIYTLIGQMKVSIPAPSSIRKEDMEESLRRLAFVIEAYLRKQNSRVCSFRITRILQV